jgi:hypothetical protein
MLAKELIRLLERDMKEYGEDAVVKVAEHQKYAFDIIDFHFDGRDEYNRARLIILW